MATIQLTSWCSAITRSAAETPAVTPAERSISAKTSTKTSPIANTIKVAAWLNRLAKFKAVKNTGLITEKSTASTIRPSIAGSDPISPLLIFNR